MTTYILDTVDANDAEHCIAFSDLATSKDEVRQIKSLSYEKLLLQPGHRVLDVGCGAGEDVRAMAQLVGPIGKAVGLDSNRKKLSQAREQATQRGLSTTFRHGDAYALPFDSNSFDACRAECLLHVLERPGAALKEMVRVTQPGGRIVVSEPDWDTLEVNCDEDSLTRRIMWKKLGPAASKTVGSRLPALFCCASLLVDEVETAKLEIRDLDTAYRLFDLKGAAEDAVAVGRVTDRDADDWLSSLAKAERFGRFRCTLTSYICSGVKPSLLYA